VEKNPTGILIWSFSSETLKYYNNQG